MATLVALTSTDRLLTFDSATPWLIQRNVPVSGLAAGESLSSIDARPANGVLYGVSNRNLVYTLNAATGVATRVGSGPATIAQVGGFVGIDFNPNVDRLRLVTGANQNLRFNPDTGAIVAGDTNLAFAGGDPNQLLDPTVVDAAYDRNFQGSNLTTAFGIDPNLNILVRIGGVDGTPSPNGGQVFTVGSLGLNVGNRVGFDITASGIAYAALTANNGGGPTRLTSINLASGAATFLGFIGNGQTTIDGLAELPREEIIYGVTASDRLVRFAASDPGRMLSSVPLRGLLSGEDITGIDFRPASGELFGITDMNRVLRIDPATGQTVQPGPSIDAALLAPSQSVGIDFNPTVDRLRLVNGANNNLRYNPQTFAPVDGDPGTAGVQPDAALVYLVGDPNQGVDPTVEAAAYDRSDNDPATATTLFAIDTGVNALVRIGGVDGSPSPNLGGLTTLGSLGPDVTSNSGLDISAAGAGGKGAALQVQGETVSKLFAININPTTPNQPTGAATLIGTIAGGEVLTAMAIAPATVQFAAPLVTVNESAGLVWITLTRTGGSSFTESVLVSTFDGTARAGQDYTPLNNLVVTFAPGQTRKSFSIPIVKDNRSEGTESVMLVLGTPAASAALLGPLATSTLRIVG
ncbi:MAG: DUF4394 domain-containing protein [Planctomycetaceae bacterium]|nr:DUF4394 domain-containing protein [Planctomycetaceae bacterium]